MKAGLGVRAHLGNIAPAAALMIVAVVIVAGLAVLPVRTWLVQRESIREVDAELTRTEGEIAELEAQLSLIQTDTEVERLARENFDLVFPGEESYRILPAPTTTEPTGD